MESEVDDEEVSNSLSLKAVTRTRRFIWRAWTVDA